VSTAPMRFDTIPVSFPPLKYGHAVSDRQATDRTSPNNEGIRRSPETFA